MFSSLAFSECCSGSFSSCSFHEQIGCLAAASPHGPVRFLRFFCGGDSALYRVLGCCRGLPACRTAGHLGLRRHRGAVVGAGTGGIQHVLKGSRLE